MTKTRYPAQLVFHRTEGGDLSATLVYHTIFKDDDGTEVHRKVDESVTLEKAGEPDFKALVGAFIEEAQISLLLKASKSEELKAQKEAGDAKVLMLEERLAVRERLLTSLFNSLTNELLTLGILQQVPKA